jgi:hypothetical protein
MSERTVTIQVRVIYIGEGMGEVSKRYPADGDNSSAGNIYRGE